MVFTSTNKDSLCKDKRVDRHIIIEIKTWIGKIIKKKGDSCRKLSFQTNENIQLICKFSKYYKAYLCSDGELDHEPFQSMQGWTQEKTTVTYLLYISWLINRSELL